MSARGSRASPETSRSSTLSSANAFRVALMLCSIKHGRLQREDAFRIAHFGPLLIPQRDVLQGTLLVIPIEESLIYIRPLYLRSAAGRIQELKRVIVAFRSI